MPNAYRPDPNPALEQLVAPPNRQTNPQRVIELAAQTAPVICSVYSNVTENPAAGVAELMNWNLEVTDTSTLHDNAVNNSRITIAVAGTYRAYSKLALDVSPGGTYTTVEIRVLVNGIEVADEISGAITANTSIMIQHEQFMNVGQYFEIQVLVTGADPALNITPGADSSYFIVQKIG